MHTQRTYNMFSYTCASTDEIVVAAAAAAVTSDVKPLNYIYFFSIFRFAKIDIRARRANIITTRNPRLSGCRCL